MSTYKIVKADKLDSDLKIVADAIRAKGGTTASLSFPNGMKSAVESISIGGGGIPDGYIKPSGTKIVTENGIHDIREFENVAVDVPSSGIQPSGLYDVTDTSMHDVSAYQYAVVTDSNLSASNIKKDVNILGILGTYEGEGGSTDAYYKIPSGKYNLTTIWDDWDNYTIDGWSREALVGKVTDQYGYYVKEPFTHLRNEACYLYFESPEGSDVCGINPGYGGGEYYVQIDLASDQYVSAGLKGWWDRHAIRIGDSEGGGGGSSSITEAVLRAGTYADDSSSSYPLSFAQMPDAEYTVEASVLGDIVGGSIFEKIVITGNNGATGEPFATATFINSIGEVCGSIDSYGGNSMEFNISNTTVPIDFYVAFTGMFVRQS